MLKTADIKPIYETGDHEPREFFTSGLMHSTKFDLSLGYFSSTGFNILAIGFADFISRGGQMRFLINNCLYPKDKEAILTGQGLSLSDLTEKHVLDDFEQLKKVLSKRDEHFFNCLSYLIAEETLSIKAVKPAKNKKGIVHHKITIFKDGDGNCVTGNGSVNFSEQALKFNVESLMCDFSWIEVDYIQDRIKTLVNKFEQAWEGKSPVLQFIPINEVKSAIQNSFKPKEIETLIDEEKELVDEILEETNLSEAVKNKLEELNSRLINHKNQRKSKTNTNVRSGAIKDDGDLPKLRPYQEKAIQNWKDNDFVGMLEMATGTGKTFTALAVAQHLLKEKKRLQIIISCPYIHLAEQWVDEAKKFGFDQAILVGDSRKLWEDQATFQSQLFRRKKTDLVVFITTNKSFTFDHFQNIIQPNLKQTLLIADEAHHAGAYSIRKVMPESIPYRLGLSATPERYGDDEGTQFLSDYFGKVVYAFPLEDAIGKYLCNYYYYPILVELTEAEFAEYHRLTQIIGRLMTGGKEKNAEKIHGSALKRAKVLNNAENKLKWLKNELAEKPLDYSIFYGGVGTFARIKEILAHTHDIRLHEFTSNQTRLERKKLLQRFGSGELQSLVAMKCLDEGVDVPPTRVAYFLASSANPREFVQRRGRVLRKYEGKEEAIIYDLIAIPPMKYINDKNSKKQFNAVKSAFKREYLRVKEFAELALNKHSALDEMFEIANKLDLTDL